MDIEEFNMIVAGIVRLKMSARDGYDATFTPEESKAMLGYIERLQDFKIAAAARVLDDALCPGCGCGAGDGLTEGCEDEEGCGFWREQGKEHGDGSSF
jgi:hypothetical protein